MGVFGRGQDADMPHDFLQFDQVDTGFQEMGGKTVTQGMAGYFFLIPI
jgi:hypothetical protein